MSILVCVVAVYVFVVNLVVANSVLLANQQVLPDSEILEARNMTSSGNIVRGGERTQLGAKLVAKVGPRYGLLPIHDMVFGDLKMGHRVFMYIMYPLTLLGLVKANDIVLVYDINREGCHLLRGAAGVTLGYLLGLGLGYFDVRLVRDFGWLLQHFTVPTLLFLGFLLMLRLYAYTHPRGWRRLVEFRRRIW